MTILLLGSNGLLGHNVLKQFLQQGHVVHALLRSVSSLHVEDFPQAATHLRIFKGSILDEAALRRAAEGCDAIVNCAGVTDMSLLHYEDYLPINRDLCGMLVTMMERCGIRILVHTSTANTIGYGLPEVLADEQAPMQAPFSRSYYALSKQEGEALLRQAALQHPDWHVITVCPGFMVGAYDTKPSSGALLLTGYRKPLMAAPKGGKSFIHVEAAAAAITHALTRGESGRRYLLTGQNMTLKEFYRLQARVCGYRQLLLTLPNWVLEVAGRLGDLVRGCGLRTQLSTRNVRQLMVREYYSHGAAASELAMPEIEISQAIRDFYAWYLAQVRE